MCRTVGRTDCRIAKPKSLKQGKRHKRQREAEKEVVF